MIKLELCNRIKTNASHHKIEKIRIFCPLRLFNNCLTLHYGLDNSKANRGACLEDCRSLQTFRYQCSALTYYAHGGNTKTEPAVKSATTINSPNCIEIVWKSVVQNNGDRKNELIVGLNCRKNLRERG